MVSTGCSDCQTFQVKLEELEKHCNELQSKLDKSESEKKDLTDKLDRETKRAERETERADFWNKELEKEKETRKEELKEAELEYEKKKHLKSKKDNETEQRRKFQELCITEGLSTQSEKTEQDQSAGTPVDGPYSQETSDENNSQRAQAIFPAASPALKLESDN